MQRTGTQSILTVTPTHTEPERCQSLHIVIQTLRPGTPSSLTCHTKQLTRKRAFTSKTVSLDKHLHQASPLLHITFFSSATGSFQKLASTSEHAPTPICMHWFGNSTRVAQECPPLHTFCFQVSMASKDSLSTVENASTHAWAPVDKSRITK